RGERNLRTPTISSSTHCASMSSISFRSISGNNVGRKAGALMRSAVPELKAYVWCPPSPRAVSCACSVRALCGGSLYVEEKLWCALLVSGPFKESHQHTGQVVKSIPGCPAAQGRSGEG